MNIISTLEKRFGGWAIPNLTAYLLLIQAVGVVLLMGEYSAPVDLVLRSDWVIHRGEWWRLLSFMMYPKTTSLLWLFFAFYIFYMMGSALEREWGIFRYNLFILSGYVLTVLAAFLVPGAYITNTYFLGGVFLAFATLFPDFQLNLFFLFPVKVKWLGLLTAGTYVYMLFAADIGTRLCVLVAFINYLLFFGKDFVSGFKAKERRKAFVAEQAVAGAEMRHICAECGKSDQTDELMHFRYCSTCGKCFCEEHISSHRHEG